ncbi:hypothetical protein, partial [Brevundimonas sp.]|uniref:hypothetical protein n=1 Tax=Brevundimonas sp. TaxID=1871086 RepID=UPI0025ED708B
VPGHYERFGERLPQDLWNQLAALNARLEAASAPAPAKVAVNARRPAGRPDPQRRHRRRGPGARPRG